MVKVQISLYGESAERFKEIQEELEQGRKTPISNAEVLRRLMGEWDDASGRR